MLPPILVSCELGSRLPLQLMLSIVIGSYGDAFMVGRVLNSVTSMAAGTLRFMKSNKLGGLLAIMEHNGEHKGQLIAYARTNGVVPPWSK